MDRRVMGLAIHNAGDDSRTEILGFFLIAVPLQGSRLGNQERQHFFDCFHGLRIVIGQISANHAETIHPPSSKVAVFFATTGRAKIILAEPAPLKRIPA